MKRVRQTSKNAHQELTKSGAVSGLQLVAWETLKQHGPLTARELDREAGTSGLWKRLSELKRLGMIAEDQIRECSVSGNFVLTWRITTPLPLPQRVEKKKPRRFFLLLAQESWERTTAHKTESEAKEWRRHLTDQRIEREIIEVQEVLRKK